MLIAKLIDIFILKIMRYGTMTTFCAVYGGYCTMAYVLQEFPIYLISIIIWLTILWLWAIKVTAIIVFSYSILFFNIYYLRLRYRQLNQNVLNSYNTQIIMRKHTKLTTMTDHSNGLFKYSMAYSYFLSTSTAVLCFIVFQYGNGILFLRLSVQAVGCCGVLLIFLITLFSAQLSREAHRFYRPMNSYISIAKLDLSIKLKVRFIIKLSSIQSYQVKCFF